MPGWIPFVGRPKMTLNGLLLILRTGFRLAGKNFRTIDAKPVKLRNAPDNWLRKFTKPNRRLRRSGNVKLKEWRSWSASMLLRLGCGSRNAKLKRCSKLLG